MIKNWLDLYASAGQNATNLGFHKYRDFTPRLG